jgi:lysophospholipase L1-like esterase
LIAKGNGDFYFPRMSIKFTLLAAAVLALAPFTHAQEAPLIPALKPEVHKGTERRIEQFNTISKEGTAELVFLGDSITQGWEGAGKATWAKYYANRKAANFGISGDRTEHVLWRMDNGNFDGLKPKLVVLMIGTNNTGHRKDKPEDTAAGVKAIISKIHAKSPDTKVLLLAIFPRDEKPEGAGRQLNDKINAILKTFADDKKIFWQDIGAKFLGPDGVMSKEVMKDFLHPGPSGYDIWAEAIEENVAKLLGEKK